MERKFVAKELDPLAETLADDLSKANTEKLKLQKVLKEICEINDSEIDSGYRMKEIALKALGREN